MDMVTDAFLLFVPLALWPGLFIVAPDVIPWAFAPVTYALSPLPTLLAALASRALRPTGQARALVWLFVAVGFAWGGTAIWFEWLRLQTFLPYQTTLHDRLTVLTTMAIWQYPAGGFGLIIASILAFRADRHLGAAISGRGREETIAAADTLTTARLADRRDVAPLLQTQGGMVLGEWAGGFRFGNTPSPLLRWDGVGSLLTIAPPGKGKGTSTVGPAMLGYAGAIVCFDPKGENAAVWAGSRKQLGHEVAVLDPFNIEAVPVEGSRFNPLDFVRNDENFLADVRVIVDALVIQAPGDKPHFHETSKLIIGGVVAFVCAKHKGASRTLAAVHSLLASGPEAFKRWAEGAIKEPELGDGMPAIGASVWLQVGPEERGSIFSTLTRQVSFLMDPNIRKTMAESTFKIETLLDGKFDLFICLPHHLMSDYSRFVRLFIGMTVGTILRAKERPKSDVLLLLDELPVLGRMNAILNPEDGSGALTIGRAAGIKIWGIVQNPAQLSACYGENGLKTWKSSCSVVQVFGISMGDLSFSEEVSKLLGETTIEVRSTHQDSGSQRHAGQFFSGRSANEGVNFQQHKRWIMSPDEIRRLPPDQQLLFIDDIGRPVLCRRTEYFLRPEWNYQYSKNPFYQGEQPYTRTPAEFDLNVKPKPAPKAETKAVEKEDGQQ